MCQHRLAFLLVVVAALVSACLAQTFEGSFTSDYGGGVGNFDICVNPTSKRMQGVYSKVGFIDGYVGVDATTNRHRFDGMWYEAGARGLQEGPSQFLPNYGPVILLLSQDGAHISGAYAYAGQQVDLAEPNRQWKENRTSSARPATSACWFSEFVAADNGVPDHQWTCPNSTWNIISNSPITDPPGQIEGSYIFAPDIRGATIGGCNKTAGLCQFDFSEVGPSYSNFGIILARQMDANTFYSFSWPGSMNTFNYTTYPEVFETYTWTRVSGVIPTSAQASVNRDLLCRSSIVSSPPCNVTTIPSTAGVTNSVTIVALTIVALIAFLY